jgi:uncharacterized protein YjbJ (UPF0337 family)
MNKDQFQGQWKQIKGKIKEKWGKLTEDDLTQINGKRDQLLGKLQQRYGYAKEKAEEELKHWEGSFSSSHGEREEEEPTTHEKHHKF